MIAEATTSRKHRQQQQRRRSAARQQTNGALRDALAQRDGLPTEGPPLGCAERQRSAAQQQTIEAFWKRVEERQREAMDALWGASSVPVPVPVPEPPAAADSPRRLVVPNVIAGETPVVRKAGPTFADVLRTFDLDYRRIYAAELTLQQDRVLREMLACYTKVLGVHEWTCGDCGTVVELPNGCNNRHCCTCGSTKRRRWAEETCSQILPIEYAHLILTLPAPITRLALINQKVLYSIVLREGAATVLCGGRKLFGVELALLALLHTWGQLLLAHVHSHCLLPMGGLRRNTLEWVDLSEPQLKQLLAYVRREFPQRFCQALRKAYDQGELQFDADTELEHLQSPAEFDRWLEPLENISWIVRCGDSWDRRKADIGPQATAKVVQYLANYVGRIALSDSRILDIQGEHVLFKYKDYRDNNQQKTEWIEGVELIHRFLQHLLPPGFRHIRRYGWMGPRVKPEKRDFIRSYHGLDDVPSSESQDEADGEAAREEEVSTQTCRFCAGDMHLTGSTDRPRVSEILAMPLSRFRQAQAGFTVTLGDRLPRIEAERSGDESAPVMGERAKQIRSQLIALMNSSYL